MSKGKDDFKVANSIIDDMLKEQVPNNNPKKNKKVLWIILILFLIIIIVAAIVGISYLNKQNEVSPKAQFLTYIGKGNLENILNFESYDVLADRMQNESSENNTEVSLSINDSDLEVDDIIFNIDSQMDVSNKKGYVETSIEYLNNELFNLKLLATSDAIAIKSDEIVYKYVGSEYANLGRVLSDITGEELSYSDMQVLSALLNSDMQLPDFSLTLLPKYIEVLSKNVNDSAFSSKNVTLSRETGNIDVTEYTMTINQSQMITISEQLLQTIKSDEELLNSFSGMFNSFGITNETLKLMIEELINSLYEIESDDSITYQVKVYVHNDQTLKLTMSVGNELTLDFEYQYGDKENSALITVLDSTDTGMKISLTKSNSDVSEKFDIVVDAIESSEIVSEFIINLSLLNSQTSYELNNKISLNVDETTAEIDMVNKIDFKDVEIEDLTDDNCLFIDKLDEPTFSDVITSIQERTMEVLEAKEQQLSFITSNTGNTVIEQPEIEEPIDNTQKEEAKQKIVDAVSSAMGEAQNNGEEYILQDIENIEIPDSEYSVVVSDDIAIITVDGYEFKLDSGFNLSE